MRQHITSKTLPLLILCMASLAVLIQSQGKIAAHEESGSILAQQAVLKTKLRFSETDGVVVFPKEPLPISPRLKSVMAQSKFLGDILPVVDVIPLELTTDAALERIADVVVLDDYLFVIDERNDQLYRFHRDGRFAGVIGSMGDGPGEYRSVTRLERAWDGHLAVLDGIRGQIHVYAVDGSHLVSTPRQGPLTDWVFASGPAFIWDQPNRLYRSNVIASDPTIPWHAILTLDNRTTVDRDMVVKQGRVEYGFGERFSFYETNAKGMESFNALRRIDNRIWLGSPFSSEVEVYDLEGRRLAVLENTCLRGMSHGRYEEMLVGEDDLFTSPEATAVKNRYGLNWGFAPIGDLVLVNHGPEGIVFYDKQGNPVANKHFINDLVSHVFDSYDDYAVNEFVALGHPGKRYEAEHQILADKGFAWNEGDEEERNPIIRLGRLVQ